MRFVSTVLAGLCVTGCGITFGTSFSFGLMGNSDVVTVVNNTDGYYLDVRVNGVLKIERLAPGSATGIGLYITSNAYGAYSNTASLTVTAYDDAGDFIGAASRTVWVSGYGRHASSWIINSRDLTSRE